MLTSSINTKAIGRVRITRTNEKTGARLTYEGDNLVVNNFYSQLAYLIAGTITGRAISQMEFGSGATAAAAGDTAVTHLTPTAIIAAAGVVVSNAITLTGTWSPAATSGGVPVTEVGLLFSGNTLAARFVFPAMLKSVDWTWVIEWTLQYE